MIIYNLKKLIKLSGYFREGKFIQTLILVQIL